MYFCSWRDTNTISKGAALKLFCVVPPIPESWICGLADFCIHRGDPKIKNNEMKKAVKALKCLKLFLTDEVEIAIFINGTRFIFFMIL